MTNILWPVNGYNRGPISQVQPFVYSDSVSYLDLLYLLKKYILEEVVPVLNGISEEVDKVIEDLLAQVGQALEDQNEHVEQEIQNLTEYVNNIVQGIIDSSIELQDPVMAQILANDESVTRVASDALYGIPTYARAESLSIPENITSIEIDAYHSGTGKGGARYARVNAEPIHAGKVQTADGSWWQIAEQILTLEMFGALPIDSSVTDVETAIENDCTEAFNAMSYAAYILQRDVSISAGRWPHSDTLLWYDGITYRGVAGDTWRTVNTSNAASFPNEKFKDLAGSVFVAYGSFPRSYQFKGITRSLQNGYGRNTYLVDRPFNNGLDGRMDLLDLTNQDAVGATPASLRRFSVAHHVVGDSQRRHRIEDVVFVPNCPDIGETFGLGGYGLRNEIPQWADVDMGVYAPSPFMGYFRFQSLGYWNDRGLLLTGHKHSNPNIGYTENNVFDKCTIQVGVAIRMCDSWPVIAKTENSITLRWTPSHTFAPSGFLFIGRSIWSYTPIQYTSVVYSEDNGGILIFNTVSDTSGVVVDGDSPHHAQTGFGAGFPNTIFKNCEIFDFSQASGIPDMSPQIAGRARAWSAALEIAGGTISNVRFHNNAIRPLGPIAFLFGGPENIEFIDNWVEGRGSRRLNTADTELQPSGLVAIGGPTPVMLDEVGAVGNGSVYFGLTRNLHVHVNMRPHYRSPSQYAFSGMENSITSIVMDEGKVRGVADTNNYRLWTLLNSEIDMRVRKEDNVLRRVVTGYSSGATGLGESATDGHAIYIPDRAEANPDLRINRRLVPGTDDTLSLGMPENRWYQGYFRNGVVINSPNGSAWRIRIANDGTISATAE